MTTTFRLLGVMAVWDGGGALKWTKPLADYEE